MRQQWSFMLDWPSHKGRSQVNVTVVCPSVKEQWGYSLSLSLPFMQDWQLNVNEGYWLCGGSHFINEYNVVGCPTHFLPAQRVKISKEVKPRLKQSVIHRPPLYCCRISLNPRQRKRDRRWKKRCGGRWGRCDKREWIKERNRKQKKKWKNLG